MVTMKALAVLGLTVLAGGCVTERIVHYPAPTAEIPTVAASTAVCSKACCQTPPQPVTVIREDPATMRPGQVPLADLSDLTLETLVRDLNDRKEKAIKAHDGAPSEEAEHLWRVLGDVRSEFTRRGYRFDAEGNCFRGDTPIKLWWD